MVTYDELFAFISMITEIITLVLAFVIYINNRKK